MNGRYEVTFSKEFVKRMRKLSKKGQIMILRKVRGLESDPYEGKPLRGALVGLYSLRQGEYRVICTISKNKISVITVGHRSSIYE
jgi:mRNA-degrading endonuclease RelE of RelBE toxin-antitoxin system